MKSKKYLEFIHSKSCLITGNEYNKDAHHVKCIFRTGVRPPDYFCVPLGHELHLYDLHESNEAEFWERNGVNILEQVIQFNLEYISIHGFEDGYAKMFKLLEKSCGSNMGLLDAVTYLKERLNYL